MGFLKRRSERRDPEGKGPRRARARPRRPRSERVRRATAGARRRAGGLGLRAKARGAQDPLAAGVNEIVAIGREMLAIPAAMALALAERLGLAILAVLRFLHPIVLAALALAKRGVEIAARELTPARAIGGAALAAALLLAISQFMDYREVRAGVPAYAGVERVAPPPRVDGSAETAGSAHLYVLALVAIAAGALVLLAMLGRWRLARLLVPLGLAVIAVAVFVDAPAGLDEGVVAIRFSGAEARLLGPFWVEVVAGAVLAVCGPLLVAALRPQGASSGRRAGSAGPLAGLRGRVQGAGT